jgi:hypothetical protein
VTTHLYCVLPYAIRGEVPAGLSGVAGARVRALPVDGLVAWVSDAERGLAVSIDGIRAHNDVVEAAMATGSTPVPARFGQRFDNDDACRNALASRADAVEPLLATMQGLVEMTLIITPSTRRMVGELEPVLPEMFDPTTQGAGRRYLDTLRKREMKTGEINHATDDVADALNAAAQPFVRRTLAHQAVTPLPLRTISHLIARDDVDSYQAAVRGVEGGAEFRFLVIGPRAPYSFCALGEEAGGTHGMNLAD